eukprot:7236703-Pyramimonas_sp.AAC.1
MPILRLKHTNTNHTPRVNNRKGTTNTTNARIRPASATTSHDASNTATADANTVSSTTHATTVNMGIIF